jgi:hypothetical protein
VLIVAGILPKSPELSSQCRPTFLTLLALLSTMVWSLKRSHTVQPGFGCLKCAGEITLQFFRKIA